MRSYLYRRTPTRRRRGLRAAPIALGITLALTTQASGYAPFYEHFESLPTGGWQDGTTHGRWQAHWNGYGSQGIIRGSTKVFFQQPKASVYASETHSSLATTLRSFGDVDVRVRLRTVRRLRSGQPNAWEVGWVLWHFTDASHFYYFIPKPNGWELGKADPAYPGKQRFLKTGSWPRYPVGNWYWVRARQVGRTISVWVNGRFLTRVTDNQRPYLTGRVGLYTEDARVHFDPVHATAP